MIDRPFEYLGNLMLLIIWNDTTCNSLSGAWLNENPDQFDKLSGSASLILVPEIIRWQTPFMHMRRIATRDIELGGKLLKKRQGGDVRVR